MLGTVRKVGFGASLLSVVGSLYIYFIESNHELGIFVGLWAPTIILGAIEIEKMLEN